MYLFPETSFFLRAIDVSRLFAKTTNNEKRIFEAIEQCAHSAVVTLNSCSLLIQNQNWSSRFATNPDIVQFPPKNYRRQVLIHKILSHLGNVFELSIQKRFLIIKLLNDCPVFIFYLIHGILFFRGSTFGLN